MITQIDSGPTGCFIPVMYNVTMINDYLLTYFVLTV